MVGVNVLWRRAISYLPALSYVIVCDVWESHWIIVSFAISFREIMTIGLVSKNWAVQNEKVLKNLANGHETPKKHIDPRKDADWWNLEWFIDIGKLLE
jgi:hypothetical protein